MDMPKPSKAELKSLSLRRAWIEIMLVLDWESYRNASLSLRRAWIEIALGGKLSKDKLSLSLRRAWIEINQATPAATD